MESATARKWSAAICMLMKWKVKKKKHFISMGQKSTHNYVVSSSCLFSFCDALIAARLRVCVCLRLYSSLVMKGKCVGHLL